MRILIVGSGGVGGAAALIAADRDFYDLLVLADCDAERAAAAAEAARARRPERAERVRSAQVDASSADAVSALCREHEITHVLNAVDPRFVMALFEGPSPPVPTTSTWR